MEKSEQTAPIDTASSLALESLNGTKEPAPVESKPAEPNPDAPEKKEAAKADPSKPPLEADKPVTKEDIARMVKEGIDADRKSQSAERAAENTRERFIREKMADLPLFAADMIPKTSDVKQLNTAMGEVRSQMQDWFKSNATRMGMKIPDISGNPPANGLSMSESGSLFRGAAKETATQLVHSGMQDAMNRSSRSH